MAQTDYKFWFIKRDDDDFITECAVKFFEGEVTIEDEAKPIGKTADTELVPVERYRRNKRLKKSDMPHLSAKPVVNDFEGEECILFSDNDFGKTKELTKVVQFLNKELAKDNVRTPNDTQKETRITKLREKLSNGERI